MNRQIAVFSLGGTRLGMDILLVKEVYRHLSVTPVPGVSRHIKGLMNLRGRVVTVIDLNVCLNRPPAGNTGDNRLLVLKTDNELGRCRGGEAMAHISLGEDIAGLLINEMEDVVVVSPKELFPPPSNLDDVEQGLIQGVIRQDGGLVLILDVPALLEKILET